MGDTERILGDMSWRHGYMETLIHGYFGTWMLGDMDNWRPVYLETQIFCENREL